tara:strand:- start:3361 stop:4266 length:906 start_codon:yes stop_codon:yes gene_type:complete
MDFVISNDELFLKVEIAAKFLAPDGDNSSFFQSLIFDLNLYTPLKGMYLAISSKDSFTTYCKGFARICQTDMQGGYDYDYTELRQWESAQCYLEPCKYTESQLPSSEEHVYSLSFRGENFPRNGNYINYSYVNLSELADYCGQVGFGIEARNIEEVCFLACDFNFISLMVEDYKLDAIREYSYFSHFLKHFPIIEASKHNAVLELVRKRYIRHQNQLSESYDKQSKIDDNNSKSNAVPTESTFRTVGALLGLLKATNAYKSDTDIISAINETYMGVRGFSKRQLEDNFKKGKDSLAEAQKR